MSSTRLRSKSWKRMTTGNRRPRRSASLTTWMISTAPPFSLCGATVTLPWLLTSKYLMPHLRTLYVFRASRLPQEPSNPAIDSRDSASWLCCKSLSRQNLQPRSLPATEGIARTGRKLHRDLRAVLVEAPPQHVGDLAERHVAAHRIDDEGHEVIATA